MRRLSGRVAFVTGAASGIGAALALACARLGADVVLFDRRRRPLRQVAERVRALGREALVEVGDVARADDVRHAVSAAHRRFERLDHRRRRRRVRGLGPPGGFDRYGCVRDEQVRGDGSGAELRLELADAGVSVTLVSPGNIATNIRRVDNRNRLHRRARDPIPFWLQMPADRAARQIMRAIAHRRREIVLTRLAKLAVFTEKIAPRVVTTAIQIGHIHGRNEPGRPSHGRGHRTGRRTTVMAVERS